MKDWDHDDPEHPMRKLPSKGAESASDGETQIFDPMGVGSEEGFDYSAFEADLDDELATQEEKAERASNTPAAPKVRSTLPRFAHPDDATYTIRPAGRFAYVTIEGRINEAFDGEGIGAQVRGQATIFDLRDVDRITSFGVRGWLKMMEVAALPEAYFVMCSESVVNQVTMIHQFCGVAKVHSIVAPYLCGACAAEFGVPFDAVSDAELLKGRQPPHVACPECGSLSELDEDPWAFFDIDRDLLEAEVPDLSRVLDHLSDTSRRPPVEKAVVGSTTRLRFNGTLDASSRIRRAMTGLEGVVVVDLTRLEDATDEGWQLLVDTCARVRDDVSLFRFEGVVAELGRRLLDSDLDDVVEIGSLALPAANHQGVHRVAHFDVKTNRVALMAEQPPRVDAAWASGGIVLEAPSLAADLVQRFGAEPRDVAVTPAPAPRAATPAPAGPAPSATPAPVAAVQPLAAPATSTSPATMVALGLTGMLFVLALGIGAIALVITLTTRGGAPEQAAVAPEPVAAPAPPPAPEVDGLWSTGTTEPPPWSTNPIEQTDTHLVLVGSGTGTNSAEAADAAKRSAMVQLANYTMAQLSVSPAAPGLAAFELPTGPELAQRLIAHPIQLPNLAVGEAATRTFAGTHEAKTQYRIPNEEVTAYVAEHLELVEFRGLQMARTPAWAEPGTRLVASPSWYDVDEGAVLVSIDGNPPPPTSELVDRLDDAFDDVPPGGELKLVFSSASGQQTVQMQKKAAAPRKPQLMKMNTQ
jgi:DNA-directed RNA polymerase subunit RPC12/RpoP